MSKTPAKFVICPECQSDNYAHAIQCWLCHRDLTTEQAVFVAQAVDSRSSGLKAVGSALRALGIAIACFLAICIALFVTCIVTLANL